MVAARGQLTTSGCAALPAAATLKLRKYVGCNRGYTHIFQSLVVPQVSVTQKYPTPLSQANG